MSLLFSPCLCTSPTRLLSFIAAIASHLSPSFIEANLLKSCQTPLPTSTIPHRPINLPQIHTIHLALSNLTHNPRRPPRHHTKTWNHHIRRHDTTIQDAHIVLDDRELANHDVGPDVDVRADERCFDDGGGADEDVVGDFEGVVGELSLSLTCQLD
jgi:hypothetical protein